MDLEIEARNNMKVVGYFLLRSENGRVADLEPLADEVFRGIRHYSVNDRLTARALLPRILDRIIGG